ncbi:MAG: cupin domain-containing protein [Gemmatimonadota bacterium]
MNETLLRFLKTGSTAPEPAPWGTRERLSGPGLTETQRLILVRVVTPPGGGHAFHTHPEMEEIIYVISGRAEQWVDRASRMLEPGDTAHVPAGVVHATYNTGGEPLIFLAMLSPATSTGPGTIDVSAAEPWLSLRPRAR